MDSLIESHEPETTAVRLSKKHGVAEHTIQRDEKFAKACDRVAAVLGEDAKTLVLSGRSGYTKNKVTKLAALDDEAMKADWQSTQETLGDGKRKKNTRNMKFSERIKHASADIKRGDAKKDVLIRYGLKEVEYNRGSAVQSSNGKQLLEAIDNGMKLNTAHSLRNASQGEIDTAIANAEEARQASRRKQNSPGKLKKKSKAETAIGVLHEIVLLVNGCATAICNNWTSWEWAGSATERQRAELIKESGLVRKQMTRFLDELDSILQTKGDHV